MTLVPGQIVVADAPMLTDGATVEFTVIVIPFDVAVVGFAQASEDVITTETTSLFTRDEF